jgi:hypothetical protein
LRRSLFAHTGRLESTLSGHTRTAPRDPSNSRRSEEHATWQTLTGSALLALAVASRGFLSAEAAWQAAHVDENFQAERWGADAEAVARREARWREFEAAALVVAVGHAL